MGVEFEESHPLLSLSDCPCLEVPAFPSLQNYLLALGTDSDRQGDI